MPLIPRFYPLFAGFFATACSGGARHLAVVGRDSSGVRIVEASATDTLLPWTLTEVHRLGGADSGAESFTEASAWSVGTDTLGHIYVLDRTAYHVETFDTLGNHLRTLGRQGGGPGELQFPGVLVVRPGGEVNVFDFGKQALVRFAPDGTVESQFSLQPYGFPTSSIHLTGDTLVMVVPSQGGSEKIRILVLKMLSPRDSLEIARDSEPTPGMVMFTCVGLNIPAPFTRDLAWGSTGSKVAVTRRVPYVIDIFDGGHLVSSIRRTIPPVHATTDHVKRLYPEGMTVKFGGGGQCTVKAQDIIDKLGTGGDVPQIKAIAFAPDGTMWVERYTFKDEDPKVDVFAATGHYLGTVPDKSLPMGFAGKDLVLFPIELKETGATVVGIFRIGREGEAKF